MIRKGKMSWGVYKLYLKSAGGFVAVFLVLLAFALSVGSTTFSSWWLKQWFKPSGIALPPPYGIQGNESFTDSSTAPVPSMGTQTEVISSHSPDFIFNRNVYAGIIGIIFLTSFGRTILFVFVSYRSTSLLWKCCGESSFHLSPKVKVTNTSINFIFSQQTSIRASQGLHCLMLSYFFRNRLKSSERVGTGQILNLFTTDMEQSTYNVNS